MTTTTAKVDMLPPLPPSISVCCVPEAGDCPVGEAKGEEWSVKSGIWVDEEVEQHKELFVDGEEMGGPGMARVVVVGAFEASRMSLSATAGRVPTSTRIIVVS